MEMWLYARCISVRKVFLMKSDISAAVVKRLPRYYRHLGELMESGVERISSSELSGRMNVTASQIRQDLNNFGGFGQQGYGYNVKYLYDEIGKILGVDRQHSMVIIGAGNLGQAIANYGNFEKRGFVVKALFDSNPKLQGKEIRGAKVFGLEMLEEVVKNSDIDIAAIAIPKEYAGDIARRLVDCGVRAFWNFAHTDLNLCEGVTVENVHLSESLMRLSYRLTRMEVR